MFGTRRALRVAATWGIRAKSGSLLLRRDVLSAHVCAQLACPTPAITTVSVFAVFRHLSIEVTRGSVARTARANRGAFFEQPLRCPGEYSDFSSFAIKRWLSRPVLGGGPCMTRLFKCMCVCMYACMYLCVDVCVSVFVCVCGGARLSLAFVSHIVSSLSLFLRSLSLSSSLLRISYSVSRVVFTTPRHGTFCVVVDK